MFELLHSEWLQTMMFTAVMVYVGHRIYKEQNRRNADHQVKIDAIWKEMAEMEKRMLRAINWERARCEKIVYDADRRRLVEQIDEKYEPEIKEDESRIETFFRRSDVIMDAAYKRYPKKEIEDFMK